MVFKNGQSYLNKPAKFGEAGPPGGTADAHASGAWVRKDVEVQILWGAPVKK